MVTAGWPVGMKRRRRQLMISEVSPSAFSRGTMPSVNPVSSSRCAFITRERRMPKPLSSRSEAPRSSTIASASFGATAGVSSPNASATHCAATRRPRMRSPSSV